MVAGAAIAASAIAPRGHAAPPNCEATVLNGHRQGGAMANLALSGQFHRLTQHVVVQFYISLSGGNVAVARNRCEHTDVDPLVG